MVATDGDAKDRLPSRATSWLDRFIPAEHGEDERRRLRMAVGIFVTGLVLVPIPTLEHFVGDQRFAAGVLAASWVLLLLALGAIRRGASATVAGHCFSAIIGAQAMINAIPLGGIHSPPALSLIITPVVHTMLVRDRSNWLWCAVNVAGLVGLTLSTEGPMNIAREKAFAIGIMMVGLTTVVAIFEHSRRISIEALGEARERAEAAAEAKSRFLANMSHEIRTPLNGVLGMLGILLETRLDDDQHDYAQTAHRSGVALLDLLNDILDFSKIEAGQMLLEAAPFDLRALVEDVLDQQALAADKKDVELISRYVPRTPTHVVGDPGRIRQIVLNLVSNAVKFTEQGHVLVTVERVESAEGEPMFRFSVEDTGIGIAQDEQARVFEHFQQVDASPARLHQGTGLGLAIVRELVGVMDGRVGLTSTLGKGSTFWFELPLPVARATADFPRESLQGLRILVVDDNEVNRWVLREQLTRWGFLLEEADSGQQALDRMRQAHRSGDSFDIALLDYHMPRMDGLELTRTIKADRTLRDTVLVMLSSVTRRAEAERLLAAGCAAYLIKPIHQSELMNVLASAWAQHRDEPVPDAEASSDHVDPWNDPALAVAEGRRILVVEDNAVNQKVAQRMLTTLGARVDVAGDGIEALELIESIPYDLVFMDVQMPRMDGLAAAREVRRRESETAKTTKAVEPLPIVAMTAHALPADRERCLAAGMNDHVSKPVTRRELIRALGRHPGRPTPPLDPAPDDPMVPHDQEPTSPPCDLEWLRANYDPSDEAIQELLELFVEQAAERIDQMKTSLAASDMEAFSSHVHALKGMSGMVQAKVMHELLEQGSNVIADSIPAIERAYADVRTFVESKFG